MLRESRELVLKGYELAFAGVDIDLNWEKSEERWMRECHPAETSTNRAREADREDCSRKEFGSISNVTSFRRYGIHSRNRILPEDLFLVPSSFLTGYLPKEAKRIKKLPLGGRWIIFYDRLHSFGDSIATR